MLIYYFIGNSSLDAFMSVYADLVVAVEPTVNTVSDHCHSMGLISKNVYDTIIQRGDLIRAEDKARILLSSIRDAISRNEEYLHQFISALNKVGDFEYLVQKLEKYLSKVCFNHIDFIDLSCFLCSFIVHVHFRREYYAHLCLPPITTRT